MGAGREGGVRRGGEKKGHGWGGGEGSDEGVVRMNMCAISNDSAQCSTRHKQCI